MMGFLENPQKMITLHKRLRARLLTSELVRYSRNSKVCGLLSKDFLLNIGVPNNLISISMLSMHIAGKN